MYSVELYSRVRRACHVGGMSERAAAGHFGIDRGGFPGVVLKQKNRPGRTEYRENFREFLQARQDLIATGRLGPASSSASTTTTRMARSACDAPAPRPPRHDRPQ